MNLYESMEKHADIGPVMQLLALVEPCDEFSKGVALVRDCFSPHDTLRALSRRKLRAMLSVRTGLMEAYQTAVMEAAPGKPHNFLDAVAALPPEKFAELRDAYNAQVNALMKR